VTGVQTCALPISWINKAGKVKLAFKAVQCIDNLNERLGLNPGDEFRNWISGLLHRENIHTAADLRARMQVVPTGLRTRDGEALDTPEKMKSGLAIVAADVSTETKAVFPANADLYFEDPDNVDPALFVRASMSIPYFFEPLRINNLPQGPQAELRWSRVDFACGEEECGVPDHALFVDGGIMSNFPIDAFHDYEAQVPLAPTFGVKLEYDRRWHSIDGPVDLFGAIFNSARHCLDYDFVRRNPEYSQLVQHIPCTRYNWLDFNMSEDSKRGLFREGAERAIAFLQGFDWQRYKDYRQQLHAAKRLLGG
jgi:NTE family protein